MVSSGRGFVEGVEYAQPGDQTAIRVLQEAAASVAATAPGAAADLMLQAIDLMRPGEPGWLESVIGTIGLLAWATRFSAANDLAARALARQLSPLDEGLVRLGISDALLLAARRVDLINQAEDALSRPNLPDELRTHFLHNLAQGLAQDGQIVAAERAFQESLALAGPGNESLSFSCRIGLGLMTALRGHLDEGLAMADACVAEAVSPETQQRMPLLAKAAILAALDRFGEAAAALEEATNWRTRSALRGRSSSRNESSSRRSRLLRRCTTCTTKTTRSSRRSPSTAPPLPCSCDSRSGATTAPARTGSSQRVDG